MFWPALIMQCTVVVSKFSCTVYLRLAMFPWKQLVDYFAKILAFSEECMQRVTCVTSAVCVKFCIVCMYTEVFVSKWRLCWCPHGWSFRGCSAGQGSSETCSSEKGGTSTCQTRWTKEKWHISSWFEPLVITTNIPRMAVAIPYVNKGYCFQYFSRPTLFAVAYRGSFIYKVLTKDSVETFSYTYTYWKFPHFLWALYF